MISTNFRMKFHSVKIKQVKKLIYIRLLSIVLLLSATSLNAQSDIPARPVPPRLVNDFTQTLNRSEINSLEQKLENFSNTTSNQIVVMITDDLMGYDIVEYADLLGDKWGVGQKEFNNGVVIVVKPKTSGSKGEVRISVGYGLDGAIPDAITNRIIDHEMIPSFQQNDYYTALDKGTNVVMDLARGEYSSDEYRQKTEGSPFGILVPIIAIIFFIIVTRRGRSGNQTFGRNSGIPLWTMFFLGSAMVRGSHHGSWGNFSGGSAGFGGGGFGGFGGGGFGGGGASGSW